MAKSITGTVLHVDLTESRLWVEHPDETFYRKYGGGSAMGLYYLLKEMSPGVDPLSPNNVMTVFTGVPTGLAISGQSRVAVNSRSPLTGAVGDSQAGGFFPAALKHAGFDGIVIRGKAKKPVYLLLDEGQSELKDASHLWGKCTFECEQALKTELDDSKIEVMQIGPAGEKLVRFAAIMNMRNRANGRTGMGAVMGSKMLKAIVVRGNQKLEVHDKQEIVRMNRDGIRLMEEIPDVKGLNVNGTGDVVPFQNSIGSLPTRNYRECQFEGFEAISGDTVTKTMLVNRDTCYGCVVRCKRVVQTQYDGHEVLPAYGGAEYETLATFGSYCGNEDLASIQYANQLCNAYGMDTISCGATISFAMDCYEKDLIGPKDTGGLELRFGNTKAVVEMVRKIANREGIGDLFAEGSARAAATIGHNAEELLSACKGQEIPAHSPQAKRSLGLIYAVNPFGADHQSSEHDPMYEEGGSPLYFERLAMLGLNTPQPPGSMDDEKVRFAYLTEVFYSALDTYCLCQFVWGPAWTLYGPAEMAAMLKAATGWDVDVTELMKVGERRLNMLRAFNAREGFSRENDQLPKKFFSPLSGSGPTSGYMLDKSHFEREKDNYYQLAGWDEATGNPTPQKLKELGLEWLQV